jgi:nicotinamidase-related amidase
MGKLLVPLGPNAVHLCIDMQNLFAPGAPWATPWMERVLPQVRALVEHAPERTIFTRFIPPQTKHTGDHLPFTQEFLAEMLGVRRTSVTTVARTLQEAGMLKYSRGKIQILDVEGLREGACLRNN